jgi:hypothetical protein
MNEEFLVGMLHQSMPTTSLPFVHTARRSYRLSDQMKSADQISNRKAWLEKLSKSYCLEEGEVVTRFP